MFSMELNPSTRAHANTTPKVFKANSYKIKPTPGEINAIIVTSLIFILMIILSSIGYLIYKKRKLLFKSKTHLPSVGYSKASSDDYDMNDREHGILNHLSIKLCNILTTFIYLHLYFFLIFNSFNSHFFNFFITIIFIYINTRP